MEVSWVYKHKGGSKRTTGYGLATLERYPHHFSYVSVCARAIVQVGSLQWLQHIN